jgi:hypothetical protein
MPLTLSAAVGVAGSADLDLDAALGDLDALAADLAADRADLDPDLLADAAGDRASLRSAARGIAATK